jgi:hypothetical protein
MEIAWRIDDMGFDQYRFLNFSGRMAKDVTISSAGSGDRIQIPGPVDFILGTNSFEQQLQPGTYSISWQTGRAATEGQHTAVFTVPTDGPGGALLEVD